MIDRTAGNPADLNALLVHLNFEADVPDPMQAWTFAAVWNYLKEPIWGGPNALVTVRPDCYPGGYVEVRYGPRLGFYDSLKVASLCTAGRIMQRNLDTWDANVIWIDGNRVPPRADTICAATVHELAHALGWPASHYPPEQSYVWWRLMQQNHPVAVANTRKYRKAVTT